MKTMLFLILFAFQSFAVTSGSYTVGSGGDYANWAAAAAATGNLTGNLTFTQISDVTDNTALAFDVALGGYTLTLTSNKAHKGNFQGGWLTTLSMNLGLNAAAITTTNSSAGAGAKVIIDGLNIIYTGTATTIGRIIAVSSATTNITTTISNCLLNLNTKRAHGVLATNANTVLQIYNSVAVNGASGNSEYCSGFSSIAIHASSIFSSITVHGMTATGTGKGEGFLNYGNVAFTMKNCASFGCTQCYAYGSSFTTGLGSTTATKCASSDLSGSEAGLRSLTATDQFQSVTLTDGDLFLKIKSTGVLDDGGVAPSIAENTTGIRGTVRPHDVDKYSIGADEFKSTRPSVVISSQNTHNGSSAFTATVTFSEAVTGLDSSEVTATNCVKAGFSGSGAVYTYTITPTGTDDIVISAPENIAVDLYGNGNTAATDKTVTYVSPSTATRVAKKSFKNYDRNYRSGFKNF